MTQMARTALAIFWALIAVLVIGIALVVLRAHAEDYAMPDPTLTPGVTVGHSVATLCRTKWGRDVRHVTIAMKKRVCMAYHARNCPGPHWELDHLISRELDGADVERNLWPQPIHQAYLKDRLENALHRDVCDGTITLEHAQHVLRTNWAAEYLRRFGP